MQGHQYCVALALVVGLSGVCCSQAQEPPAKLEPKTQLETFLSKKGTILVKVFHSLGTLSGTVGTSAELTALTLYEPGKESVGRRGIKIEVKGGGRLEREHTSFLDLDEVDALVRGLDYMADATSGWAANQTDYTEMVFSTKGDFQVGFYVSEGQSHPFVASGTIGAANAFLGPEGLKSLRGMLAQGQNYLQSNSK